ncbi:MAG TPA: DUF2254 domain-containing protein [Candidatus Nanopelagicales bacterium]|nr:DUF2254 domain-containing protein [Candidatus Nanopelagicales bacterium]
MSVREYLDAAKTKGNGRPVRARGRVLAVPAESRWSRIWRPFWTLPAAICLVAVVAGLVLPPLEERISAHIPFVFQGGPDGARSVLGTIASAMISVTGLIFSITMVVLQLASSQFTPRVLGTFLSSRITQLTLGVFTATFVFSLSVLRYVKGANENGGNFVPQTSVTLAFALVLASVACFVAFIHFITTSIQVAHVISRIGDNTVDALDAVYPAAPDDDDTPRHGPTWSPVEGAPRVPVLVRDRHGSVTHIDAQALVDVAARLDAVITVDVQAGQFATSGQQVARVWGRTQVEEADLKRIRRLIWLGGERQLRQDVGFGLRQLVDIAERALSPGINDPTTAVQVIDEIHRILRELVVRETPSPYVADPDGRVRVVHQPQAIDGLIELGVREIAHYGSDSPRVLARLTEMLTDLRGCALNRYGSTLDGLLGEISKAGSAAAGQEKDRP